MSSRTKKTFAWLWMAALLTATIGISVRQIYCYCLGKTTISVFTSGDACASVTQATPKDCCTKARKQAPSCCDKNGKNSAHDRGCTKKSTKVFQLKTEFVVENPFEKSFEGPLWLQESPMFRHFTRPVFCCEQSFFNKAPPPSPSGRDICLRHHLFRC